ncbi:zinc-binding dehydrogenase [Gluconobacter cerinus]|uniref:zinc-binding dehydrogenase n=1 Tax=Gluconobacter cerinus TaxID=38307 RepID=UPI001B8CD69A|nr:zinc-binding dehydrogenase [Gluconobacter cerinus]MBS1045452.1 alcohol dehydrogenase catalytic domain-containing protein [Gluconobacter cerinus]
MRSLRVENFRKPLVIHNVPIPEIGEDDALVRVTASGICRTDWHLWNGDWSWVGLKLPMPTTLGHEIGGVVERIGSRVIGNQPGTRVTVPFNFACGHCPCCVSGTQNLCDNASWPFLLEGSGGWAEYVRVPNATLNCVALPDGVTELDAAALGCRYMTAYRAVHSRAAVRGGETVAVVGLGGVGLAAVEIANALGAQVIGLDRKQSQLAAAKKLGAVATINIDGLTPEQIGERVKAISGGRGVHVSIDAVGVSKATLTALYSLRKGGRLATVGLSSEEDKGQLTMPIDLMVFNEWSMAGSLGNPQSEYPGLLNMIAAGRLKPRQHITEEVALENVQSVLDRMPTFETNGYVVVTKFN